MLGFNMFAYCNNTPIVCSDSSGNLPIRNTMLQANDGGGAISTAGNTSAKKKASVLNNTDEQTVINAKMISFYKGVPVIKMPMGTDAFSFGVIFLGSDVGRRHDAVETVKHEYGHAVHFQMIGPISYAANVAIPSVIGYHLGNEDYQKNYYSQVYEYTADMLGGVNRTNRDGSPYQYKQSTKDYWGIYLLYSLLYA